MDKQCIVSSLVQSRGQGWSGCYTLLWTAEQQHGAGHGGAFPELQRE